MGVENTPCKEEAFLRKRLKELRRQSGHTQESFAEQAKFSYKYYQGIERGQWTNLRLRTISKLAAGYGLRVDELFAPDPPKVKKAAKGN